MNKTLLAAALLLGATAQAQVGINTAEPKATLHVNSKNPAAGVEGIVYPRYTGRDRKLEQGRYRRRYYCLEYQPEMSGILCQ